MTLARVDYLVDGVFGNLITDDGLHVCFTCEHAFPTQSDRAPGSALIYLPKIPKGVYTCIRRLSPKFGYEVFMLTGPGADGHFYELHRGNTEINSDGCVLVGAARSKLDGVDAVIDSKIAFEGLMKMQEGINKWKLTIY